MAIVGFTFTKILGEKSAGAHGKININNNVALTDVQEAKLGMAQGKTGLRIHFQFTSKFQPSIGVLLLEGDLLLLEDAKLAADVLKEWGASKTLPKQMMGGVLNHILERTNVQALIVARDLGLPAPIPMPKVNVQGATEQAKAEEGKKPKKK